jgi:hypothetical protein
VVQVWTLAVQASTASFTQHEREYIKGHIGWQDTGAGAVHAKQIVRGEAPHKSCDTLVEASDIRQYYWLTPTAGR